MPIGTQDTRNERRDFWFGTPGEASGAAIAGRAALVAFLLVWTIRFLGHGPAPDYLAASFMHLIHLPFHEAGHVLLSPFGRFVTVLGGSLFQVAVPVVCAVALLKQTSDPFGAAVATWWAGQSLMDLAPYIADARALKLVLLGGHTGAEVEGHDWEYLLGALGGLRYDTAIGRASFTIGAVVMVAALAWGAAVVWRQWTCPNSIE
jgi:hypothetical protein